MRGVGGEGRGTLSFLNPAETGLESVCTFLLFNMCLFLFLAEEEV